MASKKAQLAQYAMLGLFLVAVGCQHSTAPLRLSIGTDMPGTPTFVENKEAAYTNPFWLDADTGTEDAAAKALSTTQMALGAVVDPVADFSIRTARWFSDDRPSKADRMLEDKNSPDNRREGMNKLADFGFLPNQVYRKRCREIAQHDSDATVRATAIRTANRARDAKATPLFIKGLSDSNEWVRLESAKALANIPDVKAADVLVSVLNDEAESRDVRVAAADALKHYRTLAVARALSAKLNDKAFVIAWQARRSLSYLTDRDYGYDAGAWLAYFTGARPAARE